MTRPGLSRVWKNVMVMYKNMVGFSNVTGNMVLTGRSTAISYKTLEMLLFDHKQRRCSISIWEVSVVVLPTIVKTNELYNKQKNLLFPAVKQYM